MKTIKKILVAALALGFLATTSTAFAALTITENFSFMEAFGEAINHDTLTDDGYYDADSFSDTFTPNSFGNNIGGSALVDIASADSSSYLSVDLSQSPPSSLYVEMDISVDAFAESTSIDGEAYGDASATVDITFVTDQDYMFSFGAEFISAFGSADASITLSNSSGDLLDIFVSDEDIFPYLNFAGGADEYRLLVEFYASSGVSEGGSDGGNAAGLMFFEATPVPIPGSLPLMTSALAVLGFLGLRRKKTSA